MTDEKKAEARIEIISEWLEPRPVEKAPNTFGPHVYASKNGYWKTVAGSDEWDPMYDFMRGTAEDAWKVGGIMTDEKKAEARIAELEAALKPFADYWCGNPVPTMSDCRRAAEVLKRGNPARLRQQPYRWIPGPPPEDASERCLVTTVVTSTGKRYTSAAFKLAPGHWTDVIGADFQGKIIAHLPVAEVEQLIYDLRLLAFEC